LFTQGMVQLSGQTMSKSKGNIVDPDEMVEKFGADTCRLYTLFASSPERDMDWNESSVEGQYRFIGRVWRFVVGQAPSLPSADTDRRALRKLHQTIRKVTADFDNRWHFNTSIAALMELTNELYLCEAGMSPEVRAECAEKLVLLVAPFAPFVAEELWEMMGRQGPLFRQAWPTFDAQLAAEEQIEIPVQVNGKIRSHIMAPPGSAREQLESLALADEKLKAHTAGKTVIKVVVVPDKLVSVVVR